MKKGNYSITKFYSRLIYSRLSCSRLGCSKVSRISVILFMGFTLGNISESTAQTPVSTSDSLYKKRSEPKGTNNKEKTSRWVLAGNVSFQIKPILINASPLLGYRFTDNWVAGLGPTYIYNKEGLLAPSTGAKPTAMQVYGGRVFAARRLYKPVFIQVETEALNYVYYTVSEEKKRDWVVNPLAGLSYNMQLGGKSFFQLTVLYNFNYNNNPYNQQLYNSPWIFRLGAGIGGRKK